MNVYMNTARKGSNVMSILVVANSKEEAWNCITNRPDGDYYYYIYDYEKFKLIEGIYSNSDRPKLIMEHKEINDYSAFKIEDIE